MPHPAQARANLSPEFFRARRAFLLKLRPHPGEREDRGKVGDRVQQKGHELAQAIDSSSQRGTEQETDVARHLVLRRSGDDLFFAHYPRQTGYLGEIEEDKERTLDQRDQVELQQRQMAQREGDGDTAQAERAPGVADLHDTLAVPAIGQRARGQAKQKMWQQPRRADQASLRGRATDKQRQQGKSDQRKLRADQRYYLPADQQHIVSIAPERNRLIGF